MGVKVYLKFQRIYDGKFNTFDVVNKFMRILDFKVILEPDQSNGGFVVTCPSLQGCYSQGETVAEAMANIKEAIELCLD